MFPLYDDGYTRLGYIEGVDGLHEALVFEYRLLPVLERDKFRLALKRAPEQEARLAAAMMARQVKSWNAVDIHDAPAAIAAEAMMLLPAACFDRLLLIVVGALPPDKRPGANEGLDDADDYLAELEAAATGKFVGDVISERDRKN
jgi:hypothetical protein